MKAVTFQLSLCILLFTIIHADATAKKTRRLLTEPWGPWSTWSVCSATCDEGFKARVRFCDSGKSCTGENLEKQNCTVKSCFTGVASWSQWSSWSVCSATCDEGFSLRARVCSAPNRCPGNFLEKRNCTLKSCWIGPVSWNSWSPWSACSTTCGEGVSIRLRICFGGRSCPGDNQQNQTCTVKSCFDEEATWGQWSTWSVCSATCDEGFKIRLRLCEFGKSCIGENTERQNCTVKRCYSGPVSWTSWSMWSVCSATCGEGFSARLRICSDGRSCPGDYLEKQKCTMPSCGVGAIGKRMKRFIVGPSWSAWSDWTPCSATCGNGTSFRVRHCDGGDTCIGSVLDQRSCTVLCSVDGQWGSWNQWSSCTKTCGLGVTARIRECDNPSPQNGGADCVGQKNEFKVCSIETCSVATPTWSDWTAWGPCISTCGNGTRIRYRTCDHGTQCTGKSVEQEDCRTNPCPIDGGWSSWNSSSCSVTCGDGLLSASRNCNNPAPQYGGQTCSGSTTKVEVCHTVGCPVDGNWTSWSDWSDCHVVCGDGYRRRNRTCNNPSPLNGGLNCTGDDVDKNTCNAGTCPPDINICDKAQTEAALSLNTTVHNDAAAPCPDPRFNSAEALMEEYCTAPADKSKWKLGTDVIESCERTPLYSALGYWNPITKTERYGILLECIEGGIKIASQSCDSTIKFSIEHHTTGSTDFRLLLW